MANYPQEFAQDAAYQSQTSRLTELWSLPRPARGLNTYNNNSTCIGIIGVCMKYTQGVNGAVYFCTQPDDGPLCLKDVAYREQILCYNTLYLFLWCC
jgi:hypothetical protein